MSELDQEKMLTLAIFQQPYAAEALQTLLADEGIQSYLRNEYSHRMFSPLWDVGGVRVELLEHDYERALQILQEKNIDLPNPDESALGQVSNLAERLPFFRKKSLEFRLWAMIATLALLVLAGIGIYMLIGQ